MQVAVVVGPSPEFLDDPGAQRSGRVDETVPDGLRAGGVLFRVTRVPLRGALERLQRGSFGRCEVIEGGRVRRGQWGGEVDPGYVIPVVPGEQGADTGAPVAALGTVAGIAEPSHQFSPRGGDLIDAP